MSNNIISRIINLTRSGADGSKFNINSVTSLQTTKGAVQTRTVSSFFGLFERKETFRSLSVTSTTTMYQDNKPTKDVKVESYTSEQIIH